MEDAKILDLYFARDEDAIRETDTAYGKRLHTLAKNILQNREDAEESVNDTYAEVWKSIPPRRPKYFFAFLASICRHLPLTIGYNAGDTDNYSWYKLGGFTLQPTELAKISFILTFAMHLNNVRGRINEPKELGKLLDLFLESLPKDSRLIFLRRYWYVDSVPEIAARYGMTESKVKMQLSRTKEKLRLFLEQEGIYV